MAAITESAKFTARLQIHDEQRRNFIKSAAAGRLLPEERNMVLEDYLHISLQRRQSFFPLFKLQINLVRDLLMAENEVFALKKAKEEREHQLLDPSCNKEILEREVKVITRELHIAKAECRAIRDIADGIAWRLFDYDRGILTPLGSKTGKKHFNRDGLDAELEEFAHVFSKQRNIAILNDLTSFIKIGDVTVRKETGDFELVEVKKGHKSSGRITRQKQEMHRVINFLNTGQIENGDEQVMISELNVVPEANFSNIENLIRKAKKNGAAIERIGDYLMVECTDFARAVELKTENVLGIVEPVRRTFSEWSEKGEAVLDIWSHDRYQALRNPVAPYSIFPFSENTRVRLMTGSLLFISYINITAVLRYIQKKGWTIIKTPDEHVDEASEIGKVQNIRAVTVRKGELTTEIPWSLLGRIGAEFLKPKTIVDGLEAMLNAGPTSISNLLVTFAGENILWD